MSGAASLAGDMPGRTNGRFPTCISRRHLNSPRTPKGHGPRIDRDRRALQIATDGSQQANFICQRFSHDRIRLLTLDIASLFHGMRCRARPAAGPGSRKSSRTVSAVRA